MRKKGPMEQKVAKVMREFEAGTLHHGSTGEIVKDRKVALAIAMSEGRKAAKGGK